MSRFRDLLQEAKGTKKPVQNAKRLMTLCHDTFGYPVDASTASVLVTATSAHGVGMPLEHLLDGIRAADSLTLPLEVLTMAPTERHIPIPPSGPRSVVPSCPHNNARPCARYCTQARLKYRLHETSQSRCGCLARTWSGCRRPCCASPAPAIWNCAV